MTTPWGGSLSSYTTSGDTTHAHPDHDTIAVFRRANKAAFEAAFLQMLLMAKETGLLKVWAVSIEGTKINANASKVKSVRYDRACAADLAGGRGATAATASPSPSRRSRAAIRYRRHASPTAAR